MVIFKKIFPVFLMATVVLMGIKTYFFFAHKDLAGCLRQYEFELCRDQYQR